MTAQDDDEALDEFEKEKDEEVEEHLGKSVKAVEVKRGWNEWAGGDVSAGQEQRFKARAAKADDRRNKKIQELKQQRSDAKMRGVMINDGSGADGATRDKKFINKYLVRELPPQFESTKQFDALMAMPIGKEWNTSESYKRLIENDVLTKAGSIIKPLKYKKDIPL